MFLMYLDTWLYLQRGVYMFLVQSDNFHFKGTCISILIFKLIFKITNSSSTKFMLRRIVN